MYPKGYDRSMQQRMCLLYSNHSCVLYVNQYDLAFINESCCIQTRHLFNSKHVKQFSCIFWMVTCLESGDISERAGSWLDHEGNYGHLLPDGVPSCHLVGVVVDLVHGVDQGGESVACVVIVATRRKNHVSVIGRYKKNLYDRWGGGGF